MRNTHAGLAVVEQLWGLVCGKNNEDLGVFPLSLGFPELYISAIYDAIYILHSFLLFPWHLRRLTCILFGLAES